MVIKTSHLGKPTRNTALTLCFSQLLEKLTVEKQLEPPPPDRQYFMGTMTPPLWGSRAQWPLYREKKLIHKWNMSLAKCAHTCFEGF